MDIEDLTNSTAFWVLCAAGYGAFAIVIIELNMMNEGAIMSWWVKLLTIVLIPIIAAAFTGYTESG